MSSYTDTIYSRKDKILVDVEAEPEQISLLKSELLRAIEFANNAMNKGAQAELREIAINAGLDPDSLIDTGIEEDNEEDA